MLRASFLAVLAAASVSTAQAYTEQKLHDFCSHNVCNDGFPPEWGLTMDAAGNLYGVTAEGGAHGGGTAYELTQTDGRWKVSILADFPAGMAFAGGRMIFDTQGNLYGVSDSAVYELIHRPGNARWSIKTLYTFRNGSDGSEPHGRLSYAGAASGALYDGVSPLYGAAISGGNNNGVIYSLTPHGRKWRQSVIYTLCVQTNCADGAKPQEVSVVDSGKIYGVTYAGGTTTCFGGCGTVYELDLSATVRRGGQPSWALTTLYQFCPTSGCADGQFPTGPLTIDGTGALIGTTYFGGAHAEGTIFKLVPDGAASQQSILYSFCALANCADGDRPDAGVTMDANGALFGTTVNGGSRDEGEVFRFDGTGLTVAYSFCQQGFRCHDGQEPDSAVVLDAAGDIFGTTAGGGVTGAGGEAFELKP